MGPARIRPAMAWRGEVEDLLYEGETVESAVDLGGEARVVVTSHRLLAFTPDLDGANFRDVDRPNVDGVDTGASADSDHLGRGVKWVVIGAVMLVAGWVVDIRSIIGTVDLQSSGATGQIGVGGLLGSLQGILDLLKQLPTLLLAGGAVFLLAGLALLAVYLHGRDRTLVIAVAGGKDLHVPRPPGEDGAATLRRALGLEEGEGPAAGAGTEGSDGHPGEADPLAEAEPGRPSDDGGWSDDPW